MTHCRIACLIVAAAALCAPVTLLAQTATTAPPHIPLQKSIGQAGPDIVPSLIVMNSRGATLEKRQAHADRCFPEFCRVCGPPVRAAGHVLTAHLLEEWAPGNQDAESFTQDPPNATISVFSKDGSAIRDAVVVLKAPKLDGDRLTFDVDVLEGALAGADGPASIFIDRFGFAAGGFARGGVARGGFARGGVAVGRVGVGRVGYVGRGAWYRGAPVARGWRSGDRRCRDRCGGGRRVSLLRSAVWSAAVRRLPVPALLMRETPAADGHPPSVGAHRRRRTKVQDGD